MDHFKKFGINVNHENPNEAIIYCLALIYNRINNEISSYLSQYNLTPAKFNVLAVIKHQGDPSGISQIEISKRLIVTPSNMTRLIDKLEKERLIARKAQQGDRRVNIIQITDKGSKLLDSAWPAYMEHMKKLLSGFNRDDQKMLFNSIKKWLNSLTK